MPNDTSQLKRQVFETQAPSRELIVRYLQALVTTAKQLPVAERDELASEMLQPFIELENPPDNDADLEYIAFQLLGGELDVLQEDSIAKGNPSQQVADRQRKAKLWTELINRIEQLPLHP
jgi:hypothetical protein